MLYIDHLSYQGAMRLKHIIEKVWERRGKFPAVRVEKQYPHADAAPIYVIRSDLAFDERGFPYVLRTGDR